MIEEVQLSSPRLSEKRRAGSCFDAFCSRCARCRAGGDLRVQRQQHFHALEYERMATKILPHGAPLLQSAQVAADQGPALGEARPSGRYSAGPPNPRCLKIASCQSGKLCGGCKEVFYFCRECQVEGGVAHVGVQGAVHGAGGSARRGRERQRAPYALPIAV